MFDRNVFTFSAGIAAAIAGCVVLLGWALGIGALKSLDPQWVSMKANTALTFVMLGVALSLSARLPAGWPDTAAPRRTTLIVLAACAFAGLLGALSLAEFIFGRNLGIDELLFRDDTAAVATSHPGRMAPETALGFLLLAAALATRHTKTLSTRFVIAPVAAALLVVALALSALASYLMPELGRFGWFGLTRMAVHTGMLFLLLSSALFSLLWSDRASDWATGRRVNAAFAIAAMLLVFSGLTSDRSQNTLSSLVLQMEAHENFEDIVADLAGKVALAQANTRGFLLTDEERTVRALERTLTETHAAISRLRELRPGNPESAELGRHLADSAQALADWYPQVVAAHRRGNSQDERRRMVSHGESLMEDFQTKRDKVTHWSRDSTVKTQHQVREIAAAGHAAILIGLAGSLILLGFAIKKLNNAARESNEHVATLRERQDALQKNEERIRNISDAAGAYLWEIDANMVYTYVTGQAAQVKGYPPEKLLGHTPMEFMPEEDIAPVAEIVNRAIADKTTFLFQHRDITPSGEVWWEEVYGAVFCAADGKVIGLRGTGMRINARKQAEAELLRSNAELEQFSYSISHDMRQPLRMISSYMQLLETSLADQLDDEKRQFFDFAIDGAKRMDAMMLGLLEYSRVGRKGEPPTWVESRGLLDEALHYLQPAIAEAESVVKVAGDWPKVWVSPDEILRLLQNLIGNALKFRVKGRVPEITVTSALLGKEWVVRVADNGVGIIPEQIGRLFQVFQRLQSRAAYEGTGIGLALCRKIVEHHKGRIRAESAGEGQGSTFIFSLPISHEDKAKAAPKETS